MSCSKCGFEIPDGAKYCPGCGKCLEKTRTKRKRGNGQGSVYKLPNGKYKAVVILGYYLDNNGKRRKKTRSSVHALKKDAVEALTALKSPRPAVQQMTFKALYDKWLPTHKVGKDTLGCYKAAVKHLEDIWWMKMDDITVDDLQDCIDDCPRGRRTKENIRTVIGLVYKFGIPRHATPDNLNLADYLTVDGEAAAHRPSFTPEQIQKIEKAVGKVDHADDILMMIYTGFRPSEYLALTSDSYDKARSCLTGGAKTEAGRGRVVTVSPKIKSLLEARVASGGKIAGEWSLKRFTEDAFYPALEEIGIDNPIVEIAGGAKRHLFTPHSCRHTFATLLKTAPGADKDKLELIGHTSDEMLRYYQDVRLEDLRAVTDHL